jgi:hypothetical protein
MHRMRGIQLLKSQQPFCCILSIIHNSSGIDSPLSRGSAASVVVRNAFGQMRIPCVGPAIAALGDFAKRNVGNPNAEGEILGHEQSHPSALLVRICLLSPSFFGQGSSQTAVVSCVIIRPRSGAPSYKRICLLDSRGRPTSANPVAHSIPWPDFPASSDPEKDSRHSCHSPLPIAPVIGCPLPSATNELPLSGA